MRFKGKKRIRASHFIRKTDSDEKNKNNWEPRNSSMLGKTVPGDGVKEYECLLQIEKTSISQRRTLENYFALGMDYK